jgi:hypothetical protein
MTTFHGQRNKTNISANETVDVGSNGGACKFAAPLIPSDEL